MVEAAIMAPVLPGPACEPANTIWMPTATGSFSVVLIKTKGTYILDFANVSSPSLMGYRQLNYGQFTDLQRSYFTFRFSFGESHGFIMMIRSQECFSNFGH